MKTAIVLVFLLFGSSWLRAQTEGNEQVLILTGNAADSEWNMHHPAICDTLNHVFMTILDSFKIIKGHKIQPHQPSNPDSNISYSQIPGSDNNNIITGSPFIFYCPYQSGRDSLAMFKVFSDLISEVRECLLRGAVRDVDVMYMHDFNNPRTLRFAYFIKELYPGVDPKMKNASVTIEFNPDTRGRVTDNYTLYRVNLILHP